MSSTIKAEHYPELIEILANKYCELLRGKFSPQDIARLVTENKAKANSDSGVQFRKPCELLKQAWSDITGAFWHDDDPHFTALSVMARDLAEDQDYALQGPAPAMPEELTKTVWVKVKVTVADCYDDVDADDLISSCDYSFSGAGIHGTEIMGVTEA